MFKIARCRGAKKSAVPVGNSVGNAQEIYPSVVNSFIGFPVVEGQLTCRNVDGSIIEC